MQRLLLISILLAGPPTPTNTGSPSSDSPPSCLSLTASLPPARPPPSLPPSLIFPLPCSRTQRGRRAGRQAATASEGRRRGGGSRQRTAVAASSREAGPAGNQEPVAAPRRGPGVPGQALPPRPYTGHPRDTPPSSAFLFHLSILPSLVLSLLPISPPRLPPSQLFGSPSNTSSPIPSLLGLSPPPECFFYAG